MKLTELLPQTTERQLLVGTTGSGKTTLARAEIQAGKWPRVLIIDPKCTYGGKQGEPGYLLLRRPGSLRWVNRRERFIQYRPDEFHQNVMSYDEVYKWAYRQQDLLVYTDETFLTQNGSYAPDYQRAIVTCGRELGIGAIFATQRPRGIDLRIISEAEVLTMFELRHRDDRKRMAEFMGEEIWGPLPEHAFWHWRVGWKEPVIARLKLRGQNG